MKENKETRDYFVGLQTSSREAHVQLSFSPVV